MRFLETTDGTLIAGDMIKSVHWTDVDDCRRIVTKDDNAYTVSSFRWALFQNDELPVIPAQPGWFLVGVWHEAASVGDHTLVPIVGWRIDGTMATPTATEPVESDYAMLAPNGRVYGAHEVYWSDIDEFMREKLREPRGSGVMGMSEKFDDIIAGLVSKIAGLMSKAERSSASLREYSDHALALRFDREVAIVGLGIGINSGLWEELDLPRFRGEVRSWDQGIWFDGILSSSFE